MVSEQNILQHEKVNLFLEAASCPFLGLQGTILFIYIVHNAVVFLNARIIIIKFMQERSA